MKLECRIFVAALIALFVVAANGDEQKYKVKRQIYYPNFDYEDLEYQSRDDVAANTGHLPIAPHYPEDPYQSNSYQPPSPSPKPVEPSYESPYNPHDSSYEHPSYRPTSKPYKPPVPAYKPIPTPYKPPTLAYKPSPALYNPPVSAYMPTPAPYKPPVPAYNPTSAPYKPPVPAYKPTHTPYKPPSPAYNEPGHKPYKKKNTIPGVAGQDYPIYNKIPYTKFSCQNVPYRPGMYANPETGCQVYHVCDDDRHGLQGASFLCNNGTLFNQETFNCDWWYNVDCSKAKSLYELNTDPEHNPYYQKPYEGPLHIPKNINQDVYKSPEPGYKPLNPVYQVPTPSYKPAQKSSHHILAPKPKSTYQDPVRPHKPVPIPTYHRHVAKPRTTYHTNAPIYKPAPKPSGSKQNYHKPAPIQKSTESDNKSRLWKAPAYRHPTTYHKKRETKDQISFVADEATDFAWGDKI